MHAIRLALTAALLLPTAPVPQQPVLPTIKVDTKLTVVDVTVTDKDGHPVHGLTQSDFTVKEDGKPQPIRNFDEYGTTIPPAQIAPQLPPGLYTNQPKPAATTAATNIILLDDVVQGGVHANPIYMMYSKQQAENYLKSLPAGTPVALMESADRLLLLQDVTTDRDVLLAAIHKVEFKAILGVTLMPPLIHGHSKAEHMASFTGQARLTMTALNEIAAYAAGIPGRKNLIWLTPGIPWLTNPSQFGSTAGIDNLEGKLPQLYGTLTAAKVAIYTIDSLGLDGIVSAESEGGGNNPEGVFISNAYRRESLQAFAEATGGKAYFNRNDLDTAIGEAIAIGSDYYAVSYTPPQQGYDGKYHTIDVKVNRPGLRLQFKNGYTSLDLAQLNTTVDKYVGKSGSTASSLPLAISQFRAGMAHGATTSSELLLAASIKPVSTPSQPAPLPIKGDLNPKVKANPLIRYNVIYSLPPGQLSLADNPDGTHKASVEFDVVAYGEDGTKLNVIRQTASVNLSGKQAEDFQKKPFEVPLQLDLPPGKLFVRVGALDVTSGKAGTLEVPQTVAKP